MKKFSEVVLILSLCASALFSQTTGKIRGKVIDGSTGEPLAFAGILVEGTVLGTSADLNGEYIIINVSVGTHTITASMMGYADARVENVRISLNITTTINFRLSPAVIKGEEVVVTAERPIIQRDVTSSEKRMTGEEITQMPVTSYEQVIALQTGAMETQRGRSGGLHIRGGRSDEVLYVVDGVNTTDPVTGTAGSIVNTNAIAEMLVISGGFDAEYGQAMSGIVNIVTREGGRNYSGSIRYTTDGLLGRNEDNFHRPTSESFFNQGYNFGYQDVGVTFSGSVPLLRNATFFSSGSYNDYSETMYPHSDRNEHTGTFRLGWRLSNDIKATLSSNYAYRKWHSYSHAFSKGAWLKDTPLYQRGNSQMNLKITHSINPKTFYNLNIGRFNTYTKYSAQDGRHYNEFQEIGRYLPWVSVAHDSGWYNPTTKEWKSGWSEERAWMWYYERRGLGHYNANTGQWEWVTNDIDQIADAYTTRRYETGTYTTRRVSADDIVVYATGNDTVFYHKFSLEKYIADVRRYVKDTLGIYDEDSLEPSGNLYMIRYNSEPYWGLFDYYFSPIWYDRNTIRNSVSFQLISQFNRYNEIKAGFGLETHELSLTSINFTNENPYLDHYDKFPFTADFYITDKIEYEDMVLKLGFRTDYFDPRDSFFVHIDSLEKGKEEVKPKWQMSPRFGISYAMTDKAIMFANYGHFFQHLNFANIYQNLDADVTTGWPTIGNPNLPPQKEIMYEGGFRYAFAPDLAAEISAYFKDVKTLLTTRQVTTVAKGKLAQYGVNELQDFALIKGVDVTLMKRAAEFLSGSVSYSFQEAKGTGSSSSEAFYFYYYYGAVGEPPKREFPLEYDIPHTIKANLNFYLPHKFGPKIADFYPLSSLNTNFQFTFASGAPYTPTTQKGGALEVGSKRMPAIITTDVRFDKALKFWNTDISLFAIVNNLLNIRNVAEVYRTSGLPDNPGTLPRWDEDYYESMYERYLQSNDDYQEMYGFTSARDMYEKYLESYHAYYDTPGNYLNPRIIRVGLEFRF